MMAYEFLNNFLGQYKMEMLVPELYNAETRIL